jgi:hypothetical protein
MVNGLALALENGMKEYINKISEPVIRAYKKETNDQIFKALEVIFKREYTPVARNLICTELVLSLNNALLKSDIMERRIQGIKCINEQVMDRMVLEKVVSIKKSKEMIYQWVQTNNIIDEIYGKRGHLQLIQRSVQILKLYYKFNETLPLDIIWSQIEDPHTKLEIYSNLRICISLFSAAMTESVINKIIEYKPDRQLGFDDLDIIVDMFNTKYEHMPNASQIAGVLMDNVCSN